MIIGFGPATNSLGSLARRLADIGVVKGVPLRVHGSPDQPHQGALAALPRTVHQDNPGIGHCLVNERTSMPWQDPPQRRLGLSTRFRFVAHPASMHQTANLPPVSLQTCQPLPADLPRP
jgi:hypothetical protein